MIGLSAVRALAGGGLLQRATSAVVDRCLTISSDGFHTTSWSDADLRRCASESYGPVGYTG